MRRFAPRLASLLALALALSGSTAVAAHSAPRRGRAKAPTHHASACALKQPSALTFTRADGRTFGVLRWKPGRRAPKGARYRVTRNAKIVGQTRRHSMRVKVVLNHRYRFAVRLYLANGKSSNCVTQMRASTPYRLPSAPQWLAASAGATGPTVTVTWGHSQRGDGALAGYRLLRNGAVFGQTTATSLTVRVSSNAAYRFTVVAVDRNGRLSQPSGPVDVQTGHSAPPAPAGLSAVALNGRTVNLSWAPSQPARGAIGGYRVLRGGVIVGEYSTTSAQITNLTPSTTYTFAVAAVDRLGYMSIPSAPVNVQTGAYQLPSVPQWLSISDATGPTVTLSWQPSTPGDGTVVGYRVMRGGTVYGQITATSLSVPISSNATYTFNVVAVDSNGRLSALSAPVQVLTGHTAPPAPSGLAGSASADGTVNLSWSPSQPARGTIGGYRVLRNGVIVGEYNTTSAHLTNLTWSTTYTFTVVAVDSLGYVSDPSAAVTMSTPEPIATTGHAYAFLLASTDQSFQDFQAHYMEIGTVSPTYYDCSPAGTLTGANVPLITGWAQARAVQALPRFNCQRSAVIDRIINSPTLSAQWVSNIVGQVSANGYDGATLDFEAGYASDRNAYTAFVTSLAAALHADGKLLMLCVSAKIADVKNNPRSTFFDYNSLSAQVDTMFVMGWGIHWTTSAPGAQDDMTWERPVVQYISTLPRADKYVLGLQLYAMDWPDGGGAANPSSSYQYADAVALAAQVGATPTFNLAADAMTFSYSDSSGVPHVVWYPDAETAGDRMSLAQQGGLGGIGFWRLGEEDQSVWSNPLLTGAW